MSATLAPPPPPPARPAGPPARPRILLVDDEPRVLEALTRTLRRRFQTEIAGGGAVALAVMEKLGPFDVVVSDMRMPEMDGAQFLSHACVLAPDTVRILLTGQSDVDAAAAAVNQGQIFRFLQKPFTPDLLEATLLAAVQQHRLLTAERELLEMTLRGSVEVMTDVLALVSPVAFARSLRLKRLVGELAEATGAEDRWAIEMAAMLSQIGAITIPPEVLARFYRGEMLEPFERDMIASAPDVSRNLIGHLPRLDPVRDILSRTRSFHAPTKARIVGGDSHAPLGAGLLSLAIDYDTLESRGLPPGESLDLMEGRIGFYEPRGLKALRAIKCAESESKRVHEVRLCEVRAGMVFAADVVAANGLVLIGRGQEATPSLVRRIQNFWLDLPLKQMPSVFAHHEEPRG